MPHALAAFFVYQKKSEAIEFLFMLNIFSEQINWFRLFLFRHSALCDTS